MIDPPSLEAFVAAIRGTVIQPEDDGYDTARALWNGMIDRWPALIVRCQGAADVMRCVDFAREHHLPLTARGGGHGVAGKALCDDGLVVDLSAMNWVHVDPDAATALVGPGACWGDFDGEAQAFGLATTGGADSRTGVAGLTLGGGFGYLARRCGLALDNLIGADVVTADGQLRRTSEQEHSDLFWALRGGGGAFGIVTAFRFRLHRLGPAVLAGPVFHALSDAGDALRFIRDFMATAPDEICVLPVFLTVPAVDPFPAEQHGRTALALMLFYAGDVKDGERALQPLRDFGTPFLDLVAPQPYAAVQQTFNATTPDGLRYYWKSQYLSDLSDDTIADLLAQVDPLPTPLSTVFIELMGGAIARVDDGATAFPNRQALYDLGITCGWTDAADDKTVIDWARRVHKAMAPHASGGAYINYLDADDDERVKRVYGRNYDRLVKVKTQYDPDNLFGTNQSLRPGG